MRASSQHAVLDHDRDQEPQREQRAAHPRPARAFGQRDGHQGRAGDERDQTHEREASGLLLAPRHLAREMLAQFGAHVRWIAPARGAARHR
jgi:hypothetical protein